jgi:hypothetical protein
MLFFLNLLFDPENGGVFFLRKVRFHRTTQCCTQETEFVLTTAVRNSDHKKYLVYIIHILEVNTQRVTRMLHPVIDITNFLWEFKS